jgi:hypothetical protein
MKGARTFTAPREQVSTIAKEHPIDGATYQSVGQIPKWSWTEDDEAQGPFDDRSYQIDSGRQCTEYFIANNHERAMLDGDEAYDPLPEFEDL